MGYAYVLLNSLHLHERAGNTQSCPVVAARKSSPVAPHWRRDTSHRARQIQKHDSTTKPLLRSFNKQSKAVPFRVRQLPVTVPATQRPLRHPSSPTRPLPSLLVAALLLLARTPWARPYQVRAPVPVRGGPWASPQDTGICCSLPSQMESGCGRRRLTKTSASLTIPAR